MSQLRVIRASAGSGKTFNLVGAYLKLLFSDPSRYGHILAVTFTNKATAEMKTRIIEELYRIATGQQTAQIAFISEDTADRGDHIASLAMHLLKKHLHSYSDFAVCTIDAFYQRIIRSFMRELGLQSNYSIEIDSNGLLPELTGQLLQKAEHDAELTRWLVQYAETLAEKGENWNFREKVSELGKEIFKERFGIKTREGIHLRYDRQLLKGYRDELLKLTRYHELEMAQMTAQCRKAMQQNRVDVEDFSNKQRGPAGFLLKDEPFVPVTETSRLSAHDAGKWVAHASPRRVELLALAQQVFIPLMQKKIAYLDKFSSDYHTARVILKNLHVLGIFADLAELSVEWCEENNAFLLSDSPVFLNRLIEENDAPFIYEKAGTWFNHFMIDEFQDTSTLQWENFRPLISNSLSGGFDNLIVGDIKQAIYRWRNSNWEILSGQLEKEFHPGMLQTEELPVNYRSEKVLVCFNNAFFNTAARLLDSKYFIPVGNPEAKEENKIPGNISILFSGARQQALHPDKDSGYIRITTIDTETKSGFAEQVNRNLAELIAGLIQEGYRQEDIALLCRKNSEASLLACYLLDDWNKDATAAMKLRVISDDALQLGSSVLIRYIILLFRVIENPDQPTLWYAMLAAATNYLNSGTAADWLEPGDRNQSGQPLIQSINKLIEESSSHSLVELTEKFAILADSEILNSEHLYYNAFRDMLAEFEKRFGPNLPRFLKFWDEKGSTRSVSAPAGSDALRILTIHRAKGLEFKIVIIPYANWDIHPKQADFIWCKPRSLPFSSMELVPVPLSKSLSGTHFAAEYMEERQKQAIDSLNLLYVAFTRAKNGLYVFTQANEEQQDTGISGLIGDVISEMTKGEQTQQLRAGEKPGVWEAGIPARFESRQSHSSGQVEVTPKARQQCKSPVSIRQSRIFFGEDRKPHRPVNSGKIMHELFSMIRTISDVEASVSQCCRRGLISLKEADDFVRLIRHKLNDIEVNQWFSGSWTVVTEAEIILPRSGIRRPDRVMFKGNRFVILDYKFGLTREKKDVLQVKEYAEILNEMGNSRPEAYLWYVMLEQLIRVI